MHLEAEPSRLRQLRRLCGRRYPLVAQFVKFCLVGLSGILLDTAVLVACVEWGRLDPRFAAVFAFLAAVTWNYALNRAWTFRLARSRRIARSYVSFVVICGVGFGVRVGVMHVLMVYAGMGARPWYIGASIAGILAATLTNFLGSKYVAFTAPRAAPER